MENLPAGFDASKYQKFIVPINSANPDYWQWGLNCRITYGDDVPRVSDLTDNAFSKQVDCDLFWEGYFYGIESIIGQQ